MNILYVGSERNDAQAVSTALRDIHRDLTVSWAPRVEDAATWLREHGDVVALIVDAQANGGDLEPIVEHRRALAPRPTLIVVLPAGAELAFDSLHPEVDDCFPKGTHSRAICQRL